MKCISTETVPLWRKRKGGREREGKEGGRGREKEREGRREGKMVQVLASSIWIIRKRRTEVGKTKKIHSLQKGISFK
jgi:hypothetical protein